MHARPLLLPLCLVALTVALFAADTRLRADEKGKAPADVFSERKGGAIAAKGKLARPAAITVGRGIRGTAKPHVTTWFGRLAVSGQIDVENPGDTALHAGVTFVVYDKAGAVLAATSQNQKLDPKEKTIWGGFVLQLPKAQLARVARYEYIWYEDTKPIGAR